MVPLDRAFVSSHRQSIVKKCRSGLAAIFDTSIWGRCRTFTLHRKLCDQVGNYVHVRWRSGAGSTVGFPWAVVQVRYIATTCRRTRVAGRRPTTPATRRAARAASSGGRRLRGRAVVTARTATRHQCVAATPCSGDRSRPTTAVQDARTTARRRPAVLTAPSSR